MGAIDLINEALNHDTPSQVPWRARLETALFEIERLHAELRTAKQTIWMIVSSNGGYTLERHTMEDYPGDDVAQMEWTEDPATRDVTLRAYEQGVRE